MNEKIDLVFPQITPDAAAVANAGSEAQAKVAREMGHCQACGRFHKLPRGVLSLHGYTVSSGFFQGICAGAGQLPYELSCEFIKTVIIPHLKNQVRWLTIQIASFPAYPSIYHVGKYGLEPQTIEQNEAGRWSLKDLNGEWVPNWSVYANGRSKEVFNASRGEYNAKELYRNMKDRFDRILGSELENVQRDLANRIEAVQTWTLQPVQTVEEVVKAKLQVSKNKPLTSSEKVVLNWLVLQGKLPPRGFGAAIISLKRREILNAEQKLVPENVPAGALDPIFENKTQPKVWAAILNGTFDPFKMYKASDTWENTGAGQVKLVSIPYGQPGWKYHYGNYAVEAVERMIKNGYLVGDIHNPQVNPKLLPFLH